MSEEDYKNKEEVFKNINEIIKKRMQNKVYVQSQEVNTNSEEYRRFKDKDVDKRTFFEKICSFSVKLLRLKAPDSLKEKWDKDLFMSGLNLSSDEVYSALIFYTLVSFFVFMLMYMIGVISFISSLFLVLFVTYNLYIYPSFYADVVRIKAGNETVMAIVYMSIYLSVSPVFLRAMYFAATHLDGPIGRDFKKILWDLEVDSSLTVEGAIQPYIKKWNLWNSEFINSLNLLKEVESLSSKGDVSEVINEAINNIEEATYDQMKKYSKDMKEPSSIIHSLGIVLPVIGMVMFPLVSIFMSDQIKIGTIAGGYLVVLPFFLWWYIYRLISKRPGAFSHSRTVESLKPKRYIEVGSVKLPLGLTLILFGFVVSLPAIYHFGNMFYTYVSFKQDIGTFEQNWREYTLNSYSSSNLISSFFMALTGIIGPGAALALYFYLRSIDQKRLEDYVKKLEDQFRVGLFELSKVLKKGIPIEKSIPYVLENYRMMGMEGTEMYNFFRDIQNRLTSSSITIQSVLFDPKTGLLLNFPSRLVKDILSILMSSIQKSTMSASNAASNIVVYLKKLKVIENLIKDTLSDILSSLKMQSRIIAPAISAVVATEAVFIVQILTSITQMLMQIEKTFNMSNTILGGATSSMNDTLSLIKLEEIVPPTLLLLIVGFYLIEVVVLMSIFSNGIENGFDDINRDILISKNLAYALSVLAILSTVLIVFFQPIITSVSNMPFS